jgi:hypothetical protein
MMKKIVLIVFCAVLSLSLLSCKLEDFIVPPTINYFTVNPDRVFTGGSVELSWDVADADSVSINYGVGDVDSVGTQSVVLNSQGEFQIVLTATNAGGTRVGQLGVRAYDVSWSLMVGGEFDDAGYSVLEIDDNEDQGYIVVGKTNSSGEGLSDVYLIKIDLSGNIEWEQTYGGQYDDEGKAVRQTQDGGYIIAGTTNSFGAGQEDIYVIKTDADGNEVWAKTYGGWTKDVGNDIQLTEDGGYVIAATTHSFGEVLGDAYLLKINENGNQHWGTIFGGPNSEEGVSVQESSDLGYLLTGSTKSFGSGDWDVFLVKIDVLGQRLWYNIFGGGEDDRGQAVQRVLSDEILEVGSIIAGTADVSDEYLGDIFLIKAGNDGEAVWSNTYGAGTGNSLFQAPDGTFMVLGSSNILWVDTDGNVIWNKSLFDEGYGGGNSIIKTADGGFLIVGRGGSSEENPGDVYIIKID